MTIFGWTFDEWAAAFYYHPVEGEMTFAKAVNTKRLWMRRGLGVFPCPSSLILPDGVAPSDPEAARDLFKLAW